MPVYDMNVGTINITAQHTIIPIMASAIAKLIAQSFSVHRLNAVNPFRTNKKKRKIPIPDKGFLVSRPYNEN